MKKPVQREVDDTNKPEQAESTIASLLGSVGAENRSAFLSHYLSTEMSLKVQAGESIDASEYKDRFPGFENVVEEVFSDVHASKGRYHQTSFHRSGGLGEVWRAKDITLDREVALKKLKTDLCPTNEVRRRFLREALITAKLQHPNIVPIHSLEAITEDGDPYYTMRFVTGRTLREEVAAFHKEKFNIAGLRNLLQLYLSVCNGVRYAHAENVIHRDLKPDNVLVGEFGEVVVLDWGLAKTNTEQDVPQEQATASALTDSSLTQAGVYLGTPAYSAPEQIDAAQDTDIRTDVYGLGAILYEILTGRPPTPEGVQRAGDVPSARSINPGVPAPLSSIVAKALSLSPEDRFQGVDRLIQEIEAWLVDEPVATHPDGVIEKSARWFRKHRRTALAGIVSTSLIALVAAGAAFGINEQRKGLERLVYAQKVNRASDHVNAGSFEMADLLLNECPQHLRDWSWDFLRGQTNQIVACASLSQTSDERIHAIQYASDGRLMIGTMGEQARCGSITAGAQAAVWQDDITFSSSEVTPIDSTKIVGGSWASQTFKWKDLQTAETLEAHKANAVSAVSLSGETLLLDRVDPETSAMRLSVWHNGNLTELDQENLDGPNASVTDELIVARSLDQRVHFWRIGESSAFHSVATEGATSLQLSDDNKRLAVLGIQRGEAGVHVWDIASPSQPRPIASFPVKTGSFICALAFSPDGKSLAVGENDLINIWRVTRHLRPPQPVPQASYQFNDVDLGGTVKVRFSPSGSELAIGRSSDVVIWDWDHALGERLELFTEIATQVCVFGNTVFATGMDGPNSSALVSADLRTHELESREEEKEIIEYLDVNDNYTVSTRQNRIRVRDRRNNEVFTYKHGTWIENFQDAENRHPTGYRVALSGKRLLASAAADSGYHPHHQGTLLRSQVSVDAILTNSLESFSQSIAPKYCVVRLWDLDAQKIYGQLSGHNHLVTDMKFGISGERLITASLDSTLRAWDVSSKGCKLIFRGHDQPVFSVCVHPSLPLVASGDQSGKIIVWNIETGKQLAGFYGHQSAVHSLAFSPDGLQLASAELAPGIRVWDMQSLQEILKIDTLGSLPRDVGFTDEGDLYCIAGGTELWRWKPLNLNSFVERPLAAEVVVGRNIVLEEE